MENKNIIIILIAIIVVLAVVAGVMFLHPKEKQPTNVKITSEDKQYEGGKLSIKLTTLNKTPLSKQNVSVCITKKGKVIVNQTIKTNSKGKANMDLDLKKGKYSVNVTYDGNENYTPNSTSQKLTVKKEVSKEKVVDTNKYPEYSSSFGYYRSIEYQDELALVETANGRYYVFAGDGAYTYAGRDSQGYISCGSYVGKY